MAIAGLILAGGRSSRMGGTDKAFMKLGGETLMGRALVRLRPQVDEVWINSRAPGAARLGVPVVQDATTDFEGPLAGIEAGLEQATRAGNDRLASIAVDTPFFPLDLVDRLAAADPSRIAVARSGGRLHPVFALWPVPALDGLRVFLASGATRKVMGFIESYGFQAVDFDIADIDPFFNVNTTDDLMSAERYLSGGGR